MTYYQLLQTVTVGRLHVREFWQLRRHGGKILFANREQFERLDSLGRVESLIGGFETAFVCRLLDDCCRRHRNFLTEVAAENYLQRFWRQYDRPRPTEAEMMRAAGQIFGALLACGYIRPLKRGFSLTNKGVGLINATVRALSELQDDARDPNNHMK
jgi:hypothetical protein